MHDTLNSERFVDQAPTEVYATLLDAGKYLCSVRTMYRILEEHAELRERRDQLRHPNYEKPVLLATGPNQVWSWDITKLLGPMKWVYFHLYVILDIFSRYVVGWTLAERESAELAKRLIKETCSKQGIVAEQLTLHADRGTSMKSQAASDAPVGPRGDEDPQPPPSFQRQSLLGESVQDAQIPSRVPQAVRFDPTRFVTFVEICSAGTTPNTTTPAIGLLTPESVHYGRAAMIVEGSPAGALGLLRSPSGAFCEWSAETARNTLSGVDQSDDDENDASDWRTSRVRGLGRPPGTPHLQHLRGTRCLQLGRLSDPHATQPRAKLRETRRDGSSAVRRPWVSSRTATHKRLLTKYTISVSQNH